MQKGLKLITLQGAMEKNEWLNGNIIISYFGGSNNIFADCIWKYGVKGQYLSEDFLSTLS